MMCFVRRPGLCASMLMATFAFTGCATPFGPPRHWTPAALTAEELLQHNSCSSVAAFDTVADSQMPQSLVCRQTLRDPFLEDPVTVPEEPDWSSARHGEWSTL